MCVEDSTLKKKLARVDERIVEIGGGTGLVRVNGELKKYRPYTTLLQTSFDRGGHSGDLCDMMSDLIGVGDCRRGIESFMADDLPQERRALLDFVFPDGTKSGNYNLAAITGRTKDPLRAIRTLSEIVDVKNSVVPISSKPSWLSAITTGGNGSKLRGEHLFDTLSSSDGSKKIRMMYLDPTVSINEEAAQALVNADKIIFCPGSWWGSIIANTLVDGFGKAINQSKAKIGLVTNLISNGRETPNYKASDFVLDILKYSKLKKTKLDAVFCNTGVIRKKIREKYAKENSFPVEIDDKLSKLVHQIFTGKYVEINKNHARHNDQVAIDIATWC